MLGLPEANPETRDFFHRWLEVFSSFVRDVDYASAKPLFHKDILAFGTHRDVLPSLEAWMNTQWVNVWPRTDDFRFDLAATHVLASADGSMAVAIAPWTSTGFHPDGTRFDRPGRATMVFHRHDGVWLGVHTHLSLNRGVPQTSHANRPVKARTAGTDEFGVWADLSVGGVTQRLRRIPAGTFMMGSTVGERNERPVHEVTIRDPFWLFDTPCTQGLWQAVMDNNPSHFKDPTRPVERVSFDDIAEFVTKLNVRILGLSLSLPSEAQWEYACRAGSTSERYHEDLDQIAWFGANSGGRTYPVKGKLPNQWGLYDMLGNVSEWCSDAWHGSYDGAPTDGSARATGAGDRVFRGGGWYGTARLVRAADRNQYGPSNRSDDVGFRLAIVLRVSAPGGA